MPTAPEPANRSIQTESATCAATTLNRVSLRRSEVGRVFSPAGAMSFRLRYVPAITRMVSEVTPSSASNVHWTYKSEKIASCGMFRIWSIFVGRLFGVDLRLHITFLLLLVVVLSQSHEAG